MTLRNKIVGTGIASVGAIFIGPILDLFAPRLKPFVLRFAESDEAKKFIEALAESAEAVGSSVCTEFVASYSEKIIDALMKAPNLNAALVSSLRRAFAGMGKDLRTGNKYKIFDTFDQSFIEWDKAFEDIQSNESSMEELLDNKEFARLFYEKPLDDLAEKEWWQSIKSEMESWTTYNSIPPDLERHIEKKLLDYTSKALTTTLNSETYKGTWDEFHQLIGTQILSILSELKRHVEDLSILSKISGGHFLKDQQIIDFSIRNPVDSLVDKLVNEEIYIQRDVYTATNAGGRVSGLQDLTKVGGYFLLAAPSGSGKSTLLARWIRDSQAFIQATNNQPEAKVCYLFFNKAEGTGDLNKGLTILGDQLLKAHYIQANVNSFNPATIDSIVPTVLGIDHPTNLIVVIDGLDEAGEPSTESNFLSFFKRVFPRELGLKTTIVLTLRDDEGKNSLAHYQSELDLPLKALILPEVGAETLTDYLLNASDKRLVRRAHDSNFVKIISEKTQGLAIYIHSLLDELSRCDEKHWGRRLAALPDAFKDYAKKGFGKILRNSPRWKDALSFISLTQVPLTEEDLIGFSSTLSTEDFDDIAWDLKRWLRKENDGWAFSHPTIGEAFYERYVDKARDHFIKRLLTYCMKWKVHKSPYVLRNYAELLRREGKEEIIYTLASDGDFIEEQMQKNALIDDPEGPLRTLQIALLLATRDEKVKLMAKFSLAHAALAIKLNTMLTPIASELTHLGKRKQANDLLTVAKRVSDSVGYDYLAQDEAFVDIVSALAQSRFFTKAEQVLSLIKDDRYKDEARYLLASTLADCMLFEDAEYIERSIGNNPYKVKALSSFASVRVRLEEYEQAHRLFAQAELTALSPEFSWGRKQALVALASTLADCMSFEDAERIARSFTDDWLPRVLIISNLARSLANSSQHERADRLFDEAKRITFLFRDKWHQFFSLIALATNLDNSGRRWQASNLFDEAESLILQGYLTESKALNRLALALCASNRFRYALIICDTLPIFNLIRVTNAFASAKKPEALKKHLLSLSYNLCTSARACAQMIILYEDKADEIYEEIRRYVLEPIK